MLRHRLSLTFIALALLLAVWPVRADASRYELESRSGAQPVSQLEARLADPAQRPWLTTRPHCGMPLFAPFFYMQDTSLRQGCAGPNARSMSLAAVLLLLAAVGPVRDRRRQANPHLLPAA